MAETESLAAFHNIAMFMRNDIRYTTGMEKYLAVTDEEVLKLFPEYLYPFPRLLITGEKVVIM